MILYSCVSTWHHHIFFHQMHVNAISTISHWDQFTHILPWAVLCITTPMYYLKRTTFIDLLCRHNWQCITQASWHTQGRHTPTPSNPKSTQPYYTNTVLPIEECRHPDIPRAEIPHPPLIDPRSTEPHYTNTILATEGCRHHDIPRADMHLWLWINN